MTLYQEYGKRVLDVGVSATALLVLSPIMLATALLIRIEDKGPALFRQTRVGRDGVPFTLTKFRSMPVDTRHVPSAEAAKLKVTRIGRFLRRSNIDELPQLLNILRGDMSVVGPRPALPSQTTLLELRNSVAAMSVRPGLTGLAQVSSYDGMPESAKAEFDGRYASNVTLWNDLKIIVRTFGYLTRRPPVY